MDRSKRGEIPTPRPLLISKVGTNIGRQFERPEQREKRHRVKCKNGNKSTFHGQILYIS